MSESEIYGPEGAEQFRRMKWASVYGAYLALLVKDFTDKNPGPPQGDYMRGLHFKAAAVADSAEEHGGPAGD